jgi:hypothetical protein
VHFCGYKDDNISIDANTLILIVFVIVVLITATCFRPGIGVSVCACLIWAVSWLLTESLQVTFCLRDRLWRVTTGVVIMVVSRRPGLSQAGVLKVLFRRRLGCSVFCFLPLDSSKGVMGVVWG